jgi:hypothetical protein
VFLLLATRFWETKPPQVWDEEELLQIFTDSPWAQSVPLRDYPEITIYLASAKPMRDAEAERRRRKAIPEDDALREYKSYLEENQDKIIVVAVRIDNKLALLDAAESRMMEDQSFLRVGKKKYKIQGHFPPSDKDPMLRLIFPRVVRGTDKELNLELYIPGIVGPYRQAAFPLKALVYQGKPEM